LRRVFLKIKPLHSKEWFCLFFSISTIVGAWLGVIPMPLDKNRPWQVWPISSTYGALLGHLIGLILGTGFVSLFSKSSHPTKKKNI